MPFAEQMRKLNEHGPRSKEAAAAQAYEKPAVTVPKTPEFASFRRKQSTAKGYSDSETEQLEEMKKHQFKARPVILYFPVTKFEWWSLTRPNHRSSTGGCWRAAGIWACPRSRRSRSRTPGELSEPLTPVRRVSPCASSELPYRAGSRTCA